MKEVMFYNFTFNYLQPDGQSKFCWGTAFFDLSESLIPQLISISKYPAEDMYNINLVAFNGLPNRDGGKQ